MGPGVRKSWSTCCTADDGFNTSRLAGHNRTKIRSYQNGNSHCGVKTIARSSLLDSEDSHFDKNDCLSLKMGIPICDNLIFIRMGTLILISIIMGRDGPQGEEVFVHMLHYQ